MQKLLYPAIAIISFLFFLDVFSDMVSAKHGQVPWWVDQSKDREGLPCCGKKDCIPVVSVEVLQSGEGYTDVMINGEFGVVHERSVRTIQIDCEEDDPVPYVCLNERFHDTQGKWFDCITIDSDGNHRIKVNPSCVICVDIPVCVEKYS
ncbi:MAG: hypothetical protein HY617_03320 [Candidatus Sungbacteria bacterium]|nr:hypothetical protein [Candidatus Sungbacteria bacterium]